MAVRTALLTSRNINLDTDFSKYIESVSTAGVITGFQVTASSVATGQARVPCIRTNLETIYAFVQNYNSISISGDGYVIISIPQEIVDNWGGNEDGTGIATVEVVDTLPTKNYLLLATITGGVVEDNRYMIPKVDELKTDIDTINAQIHDLDVRVDRLENLDAIDHLEERALVWEKYALTDTLFKQLTPALSDCTVEANVWYDAASTEIHIQRQGSGTASNTLKLKLKKAGSPANLVVEVRKWVQVDVSSSEAYWYWDSEQVLATGSIAASDVTTSWQELEVELDAAVWGTEGELLDIVLYQTNSAVSNANYYVMACDSTQWSEGFSYVKVNGTTRAREKLMPYCVSGWFAQALLSKAFWWLEKYTTVAENLSEQSTTSTNFITATSYSATAWKKYLLKADAKNTYDGSLWGGVFFYIWDTIKLTKNPTNTYETYSYTIDNLASNNTLYIRYRVVNGGTTYIKNAQIFEVSNYINNDPSIKGTPRELKDISQKASITLFWVHIDNDRIPEESDEEKFIHSTTSWQLDFVKSKGTLHTTTAVDNYTMKWFWYAIVSRAYVNAVKYVYINNIEVWETVNYTNGSMSGLYFLKPGDKISISGGYATNRDYVAIYDYY